MKKKVLSILLAISFVFSAGMLLVGCRGEEGEDQSKLHDKFCMATSLMSSYREPVTYIYDGDLITEKVTYNNTTKEFAYLKLSAGGNILAHENTKIFNDDIAYFSDSEEKVVDTAYVEKLANDKIFDNFLDAISLDYSGYKADLESQVEEGKAAHINDGYTVTNAYYKIEYKTLADNKYNQTFTVCYEYEKMNSGAGRKLKYEKTTSTDFSNDWIISVKENYDTKIDYYTGGQVERTASDPHEKIYNFSKLFDNELYTTIDLSNATLPTQVETAKLVLVYSAETSYEENVAFNINIAEKAKEKRPPEAGTEYEFYLDENFTTKMPEGYQLNTQETNKIYIKTVVAEGYTQITEIYQDSQGVRGTKPKIVRLNSEVEFNKVYDGKTFDGQVFVDEQYTTAKSWTFTTGKSHTILYVVEYNVDVVTATSLTFKVDSKYYEIPEGTPGEQTLRQYFNKKEVKVYGVYATSGAFSLEIKTYDGDTCSLEDSLINIKAGTYTVTSTINTGWVVVKDQYAKTVEYVNEHEITFILGASQKLWLKAGDVTRSHDSVDWSPTKVGRDRAHSSKYDRDKGEYITIETLTLYGFELDTAYYIYITG